MTDYAAPAISATAGQKKTLVQILFSFEGRLSRKPFWLMGTLLPGIVFSVALSILVTSAIGIAMAGGGVPILTMAAIGVLVILSFWISLATQVKRLHDVNKSGAYWCMNFIPLVGGILVLIKFCERGTVGDNQYGPDDTDLY